jgi:hypothetical protein
MRYIIATKEEIDINVGDEVRLVDDFQAKLPGFFLVVEALETYLVIDFKESGIFGFSPELIAAVKKKGSDVPIDLSEQVVAIVNNVLPGIAEQVINDAIKKQVTPEFIESLIPGVVENRVRQTVGSILIEVGNGLIK